MKFFGEYTKYDNGILFHISPNDITDVYDFSTQHDTKKKKKLSVKKTKKRAQNYSNVHN